MTEYVVPDLLTKITIWLSVLCGLSGICCGAVLMFWIAIEMFIRATDRGLKILGVYKEIVILICHRKEWREWLKNNDCGDCKEQA